MNIPVITFFNNKGGVGKTSLVYHIAWMLALMGKRVVVCDLDPQANLTSAFLQEDDLIEQMESPEESAARTIYQCVEPLTKVGDLKTPDLTEIHQNLALIQGDLALSSFEDQLSGEWPQAVNSGNQFRAFRVLTAFWQVMQRGAEKWKADVVLADVGPNLGAINRSVLIASDHLIVPLGADLFSLQGLRNLGPTLARWRKDWGMRLDNWGGEFAVPDGKMQPLGYVIQQHSVRLNRPVVAYDRWINRIPEEYARRLLNKNDVTAALKPKDDPNCLATLKHYRSLVPMAQEYRKPIFSLTVADGAIGNHSLAVREAFKDFRHLSIKMMERAGLGPVTNGP